MVDPISLVAIGAAVGSVTGKFTEKAWDSGEKWIKSFFQDHQAKAQERAKENTLSFLNCLSAKIFEIEKDGDVDSEIIENALDHPDFSILLQKAIINASQSENASKHDLLAKLVSDRLLKDPESTVSLASKLACDAIGNANQRQLKLLALGFYLQDIRYETKLSAELYHRVLMEIFKHFMDIEFYEYDLHHLEALSCIRYDSTSEKDLSTILLFRNGLLGENDSLESVFDEKTFLESDIGSHIKDIWTEGFAGVSLTSVGSIIGSHVYAIITGSKFGEFYWD